MTVGPPLPAGLAEIADHAGREAAMHIALAHGGQVWRVPTSVVSDDGAALVRLIGMTSAKRLIWGCGGDALDIPLARRAVAVWLAGQGQPPKEIARQLRMSASAVRRYLRQRNNQ